MKHKYIKNNRHKIVMSKMILFGLLIGINIIQSSCTTSSTLSIAPTISPTKHSYFVDGNFGSDSNPGSQVHPWKTIQKCLDFVKFGDTCQILKGAYNEALVLKTSGIAPSPITIKCETPLGCTINSGASRSLITNGAISHYTIDGFRFISTLIDNSGPSQMGTVNFAHNFWGDGAEFELGNDGFTLRNCYVEGAIWIYGSDNLVENCELNGNGVYSNGLIEGYNPSQNNIFRNNTIHDYTQRGGWSLQYTNNTLWEGNTFYNNGKNHGGEGIDCDGAGHAVYGCNIKGNIFYDIEGEAVILLENAFDSIVENNLMRDSTTGISVINYNINNGDDPFKSDKDYKGLMTNTIIRNNVIYNMSSNGVLCKAVRGNQLINNTIYNIKVSEGYWGAIGLTTYTNVPCPDWTIKNNIVSQSPKTIWYEGNPVGIIDGNLYDTFAANIYNVGEKNFTEWQALGHDIKSKTNNPLFINADIGDFHLQPNSPACVGGKNGTYIGAYPCY